MSDLNDSAPASTPAELQRDPGPAQPAEPGAPARAERGLRFWNSGTWWWSALVLVVAQTTGMRVEGIPDLLSGFDMAAFLLDALAFAFPWLLAGVVVRTVALSHRRRKGKDVQSLTPDQWLFGLAALALLLVVPTAATSLAEQFTRDSGGSEVSNDAATGACDHAFLHLGMLNDKMADGTADPGDFQAAANELVQARSMVLSPANSALAEVLAGFALELTDLGTSLQLGDQAALNRAATGASMRESELLALCSDVFEGNP